MSEKTNPALKALHNQRYLLDRRINILEAKVRSLRNERYKVIVAIRAMEGSSSETFGRDILRDILAFIENEPRKFDSISEHMKLIDPLITNPFIAEFIRRMKNEGLIELSKRRLTISNKGQEYLKNPSAVLKEDVSSKENE